MQVTKRVLLNKWLRFDVNYNVCLLQMRDDFIFRCVSVLIQTQFTHFFKNPPMTIDLTGSICCRAVFHKLHMIHFSFDRQITS